MNDLMTMTNDNSSNNIPVTTIHNISDVNFNLQLTQINNKVDNQFTAVDNNLTGNTLIDNNSNNNNDTSTDTLEINSNQIKRRLSISHYNADRSNYYEYETFNAKYQNNITNNFLDDSSTDGDNDEDDNMSDILNTNYGINDNISTFYPHNDDVFEIDTFNRMSFSNDDPNDNNQLDPILNRGMDSTDIDIPLIITPNEMVPTSSRRKMREYLGKFNIFNNSNSTSNIINANDFTEYNEERAKMEEIEPSIIKKTFSWRKSNILNKFKSKEDVSLDDDEELMADTEIEIIETEPTFSINPTKIFNSRDDPFSPENNYTEDNVDTESIAMQIVNPFQSNANIAIPTPASTNSPTPRPKVRGRKPSLIPDSTKHFECEYCARRFKRQEHMKRHVRSLHLGSRPYSCHLCSKKFSRSDNLNQHTKTHVI